MVIWSKAAKAQLHNAFNYISKDSLQNAEKIRDEIIDLTINLSVQSEIYPLDKYKKDNDGTYRAFEIYRYRISYRVTKQDIHILRIRHTSMTPLIF